MIRINMLSVRSSGVTMMAQNAGLEFLIRFIYENLMGFRKDR